MPAVKTIANYASSFQADEMVKLITKTPGIEAARLYREAQSYLKEGIPNIPLDVLAAAVYIHWRYTHLEGHGVWPFQRLRQIYELSDTEIDRTDENITDFADRVFEILNDCFALPKHARESFKDHVIRFNNELIKALFIPASVESISEGPESLNPILKEMREEQIRFATEVRQSLDALKSTNDLILKQFEELRKLLT